MNGTITKEIIKSMIYEIRGKKVMLASDVSITKCNGNMVAHYDIGIPISVCN